MAAGDLIVHYRSPHIIAFSRALENGSHHGQLPLLQTEDYGAGWRFRTEYFDLKRPVHRDAFRTRLVPLRVTHYPIDSRGVVRQGYVFPFDLSGLSLVLSSIEEELPPWVESYRPGRLLLTEEIAESPTLMEGAVSRISVNAYERNPEARRRCIEHHGAKCFVCEFDFGKVYGEVAGGYIHVHHVRPISEVGECYVVDPIKDLRPVCPNCHAVIHLRRDFPYTAEKVKEFLISARRKRLFALKNSDNL